MATTGPMMTMNCSLSSSARGDRNTAPDEGSAEVSFPPDRSGRIEQDQQQQQQQQQQPQPANTSDDPQAGRSRTSPTRGVKKVPSLRRGAAGYAQLLQSAVMASIESKEDGIGSSDSFNVEDASNDERTAEVVAAFSSSASSYHHQQHLEHQDSQKWNSNDPADSDRRGQKHRRDDGSDTAPRMPRRLQSRDSSSSVVCQDDDDSDSDDNMDLA